MTRSSSAHKNYISIHFDDKNLQKNSYVSNERNKRNKPVANNLCSTRAAPGISAGISIIIMNYFENCSVYNKNNSFLSVFYS